MDITSAIHTTGAAYDALGLLAAPRVFADRRADVDADALRAALARFADMAERLPDCADNARVIASVPLLRRLIADLPGALGEEVPRPLVLAARAILGRIEFPAPEEGWDAFRLETA